MYLNYFNFISLSYFSFYFKVNLKIGFFSYNKKLNYYFYKKNNSLFFYTKGLKLLFRSFILFYNILKFGYFIELLTVGLGYKVNYYKSKNKLCFELNYSHRIFFNRPSSVIFRVFKKRFLVFGIDKNDIVLIAKKLRALRSPNIYKGTGIRYKSEKVVLKVGKIR